MITPENFLFDLADEVTKRGDVTQLILPESRDRIKVHCSFINSSNLEVETSDEEVIVLNRISWVTDIEITPDNVMEILRCGRARWRIENENFNTINKQGYIIGHNYGLSKKRELLVKERRD